MPLVYNIPYKPKFNGIELVWACWKKDYWKQMLNYKANTEQDKILNLIKQIGENFNLEIIQNCANKGWENCFKYKKICKFFKCIN